MHSSQHGPGKSLREIISGPAAVIVLLAFFMPWITISCNSGFGGVEETFSGYDLTQDQSNDDVEEEGDVALWLIPIAALVVLGAFATRFNGQIEEKLAGLVYIIAGGIGLAIQFLKYLALRSDMQDAEEAVGEGMVELSYKYGWWLTALGLIAIIVAGFIHRQQPASPPSRSSPTPLDDFDDRLDL